MKATASQKKIRKPRKTSDRKRPNKNFIQRMAEFRGFMTGNEKTLLTGLTVKNALQRINNRAMDDDATTQFSGAENAKLQELMKAFVKGIDAILK